MRLSGNATPTARNLSNCRGTGGNVPFVKHIFEWGVIIATFLSVLSNVPSHCARLTYFLHPKMREIHAVLITPQPIALPLQCACGAQEAFPLRPPPSPQRQPTLHSLPPEAPGRRHSPDHPTVPLRLPPVTPPDALQPQQNSA